MPVEFMAHAINRSPNGVLSGNPEKVVAGDKPGAGM
jgi:hypothetical protein